MGVTILENALTAQRLDVVTHLILTSSGLDYAGEETPGSERLSRLPKVTQLVSIQTQIWSWAGSTESKVLARLLSSGPLSSGQGSHGVTSDSAS